jgi:hypothetical protein
VTSIGSSAFQGSTNLASVTIPGSVSALPSWLFSGCTGLTNVVLSNGLTGIGFEAFFGCTSLVKLTVPPSVTTIENYAFSGCTNLQGVYFQGNAPGINAPPWAVYVFTGDPNVTVYYLPGTEFWGATFGDRPTAIWTPQLQTRAHPFGPGADNFGFSINWAPGMTVVVEAATGLANPTWTPLQTNTLATDSLDFTDPKWTNYPSRFYRVRSP